MIFAQHHVCAAVGNQVTDWKEITVRWYGCKTRSQAHHGHGGMVSWWAAGGAAPLGELELRALLSTDVTAHRAVDRGMVRLVRVIESHL